MITNARFAVVYVGDQQQALEFFRETLGCEVLTDAPYGDGSRWIEVRPPDAQTSLVLSAPGQETREALRERLGEMANVWFDCDDLDATFSELRARGVTFSVEPQAAPWDPDSRWAQFADPDGNLYGLSERAD